MEEFRPWLADRLALTLINRQQIGPQHFREREGGAVEFTDAGRKLVIKAYQEHKQDEMQHPLLEQNARLAQMPFLQARVLARHLRGDLPDYIPMLPKQPHHRHFQTMLILVTYDISTVEKAGVRRLRRVAQACEDYGTRVQKSVFECQVGQQEWVMLRDRLLTEIKEDEDSLRFYFIDQKALQRTEHHGMKKPLDLTEPLVL